MNEDELIASTDELVTFLRARYDEDGPQSHVAERRVLAIAESCRNGWEEKWAYFRLPPVLALPYIEHADYRAEWYPEIEP